MSVTFCFSRHYRAAGLMWRSPSSIDRTLGCLLLGASMAFADALQPAAVSTESAATNAEMTATVTTTTALAATTTATVIEADKESEMRRAASSAISAVSRLFVGAAAVLSRALLPVVAAAAAAEPRTTVTKPEALLIEAETVGDQDGAESVIKTESASALETALEIAPETENGTEAESESEAVSETVSETERETVSNIESDIESDVGSDIVSESESECASVNEASAPLPVTLASVPDGSRNTPSDDGIDENEQGSAACAPKIEVGHETYTKTDTKTDTLRALLVDAEDRADVLAGLLIQSETHIEALLTYNSTLRLMRHTSRRMSQCETAASTTFSSSTIDQDRTDQDEDGVDASVCITVDNTTSCAWTTAATRIASAVTNCGASKSWRGSSAVRQQLACRAIRQIPHVSQWDAVAVIDTLHLEPGCEVDVADRHVEHQLQETVDASAVCEQLSTALDASVYVLTTPTGSLRACMSVPASPSATEPAGASPRAGFFAFDAKQRVVRACSAVEWLSALTAELVTARRCPVILRARDLDLAECSLLRFADVVSASPLSTNTDYTDDVGSDDGDSDDGDSDDDDGEGIWV